MTVVALFFKKDSIVTVNHMTKVSKQPKEG